jgi:hypothetical protein
MTTVSRRAFLAGTSGVLLGLRATSAPERAPTRRWTLTVTEPEGIRRFGYPVSATLTLDRAPTQADHFRLLDGDRPVAAQFRTLSGTAEGPSVVALDFNVSHAPHEKRTYTVEYGPEVPAANEPKGGMSVTKADKTLVVSHGSSLQFEMASDLGGLLRNVRGGKTEYLRPESRGLALSDRTGKVQFVRNLETSVTRSGPLAVGVRGHGATMLGDAKAVSTVDLDFPSSKSWVRVDWRVDDPGGAVMGMHAMLNLNIKGTPALIDFGAGSSVYVHLKEKQSAMLRAGRFNDSEPLWETLTGKADPTIPNAMTPYVVAPKRPGAPPAEGWAHVMDRERCAAVAVADFAADKQRSILSADADGLLQIGRTFAPEGQAPPRGSKLLKFWLHFVGMPVHVGALTSPQAMLAPLRVEVKEAK